LSATVLIGTNRLIDCDTVLSLRGTPLLRVKVQPLRVSLTTPPDLPSGRALHVEANQLKPPGPPQKANVRVIAEEHSVAIFWEDSALVIATALEESTAHVKIDLRRIGINVFDDADGLHVGPSVLARNTIETCETAIALT